MISTQDLYSEIEKYDALTKDDITTIDDVTFRKAVIKALLLNAKLAHNNRTNLVNIIKACNAILKKFGLPEIRMSEGRKREERSETTKEF